MFAIWFYIYFFRTNKCNFKCNHIARWFMKLLNTKFNGVYYRESSSKKHNGKPDRCFYVKYYIDKKQKQVCIGWLSDGYSAQYAANMRNDLIQKPYINNDIIFKNIYDNFMDWARMNKKTWQDDECKYNHHIKPYFENLSIKEISTQDINNLLLKMKTKGKENGESYAPMTIKHVLLLIKRIFNYNIQNGIITLENPANNVKLERFDNTRLSYLYEDEIARMFHYLDSGIEWYNDVALIKFAFYTGLRRGELFSLTWNNVDIDNKRIFLYDTKGGKNESIIITDNALQVLLSIRDKCGDDSFVFPSKNGGRRNDIKKLWKRIKTKANIRSEIRFHDIRHTFGTLATATIPVKVVQKMMTHKNIQTTLRYAHIQEQELIDAANNLGQVFSNIGKK